MILMGEWSALLYKIWKTRVVCSDCQKSQHCLAFFDIIKPEAIDMLRKEKLERN